MQVQRWIDKDVCHGLDNRHLDLLFRCDGWRGGLSIPIGYVNRAKGTGTAEAGGHCGRTNLQRRILIGVHLSDAPVAFRLDNGLVGAAPYNGTHGISGCKRISLAQEFGQLVTLAHADRYFQMVILDVDGRWRDFFNDNRSIGYRRIVIMRWDLRRGKRYL